MLQIGVISGTHKYQVQWTTYTYYRGTIASKLQIGCLCFPNHKFPQSGTILTIAGWHLFTSEIWDNSVKFNHWREASCDGRLSIGINGKGDYTGSPDLYMGCKTCSDTTVEYILYSVWVGTTSSCADNPLSTGLSNGKSMLSYF